LPGTPPNEGYGPLESKVLILPKSAAYATFQIVRIGQIRKVSVAVRVASRPMQISMPQRISSVEQAMPHYRHVRIKDK
jgi:hypothetical protein